MDPKIAQKLFESIPEVQDFVAFVKEECFKLNQLADIKIDSPIDLAVEVKARQRAMEVLIGVLKPLLSEQDFEGIDKREYTVDVEN